jgi:hypothetical protein
VAHRILRLESADHSGGRVPEMSFSFKSLHITESEQFLSDTISCCPCGPGRGRVAHSVSRLESVDHSGGRVPEMSFSSKSLHNGKRTNSSATQKAAVRVGQAGGA